MLRLLILFSVFIWIIPADMAMGQTSLVQASTLKADLDSFFKRLGFEDYDARIKESLEKKRALNEIGLEALRINYRRYAMVNHARRMAIIMLEEAYPRLQDREFRKNFIAFSVKCLALKPLAPPLNIPQGIKELGFESVDSYLETAARNNMRRQSTALVAEYAGIVFPRSKNRLELDQVSGLMGRYVMRAYLDPQIGNTQWLGRALILGLARYSVLRDKTLLEDLRAEVSRQNLFMENYIGSTLVLAGKEGSRKVKVETGDLIFERSRDTKESAAITAAALPQDERAGKEMGLIGSLSDAILDVSKEERAAGLTWIQRQKIIKAQEERFSRGMTHVAQLVVYRDDLTGIEHTLIWDDYPFSVHLDVDKDEEWGGIRLNGIEHFANPGEVMRVGIVTLDKAKLFRIAKTALALKKKQGWKKHAWISYIPKINKDREILPQERPVRHDWEYQISQNDFFRLHGIQDQRQWLKEYQNILLKGWKTMMTDWGIWFYWIDAGAGNDEHGAYQPGRYWFGGMYCSQAVNFASLLFAGLDIEVRPSHYARSLAWIQKTGINKAKQLDLKAPVIAPSSFALQPYSNPLVQVSYPPYNLTALAQFAFKSQNSSNCPDVLDNPRDQFNGPLDKGERAALITRERKFIEYINLETGKNHEQIFGKGQHVKRLFLTARAL